MDAFDALREADENRRAWATAARTFARLVDRVVDPNSVKYLERVWAEELAKPLAPASKAWDLVAEARQSVCEDLPLTWEEMRQHDDLKPEHVIEETRAWQEARLRRDEEVENEVARDIAAFSGS